MEDKEKYWHEFFEIAVIIKAISALMELIGGFLLFIISPARISGLLSELTRYEIVEDLRDYLAAHLSGLSFHITASGRFFGSIYLLSHAIVRLFLVWGLIRKKLWAYPTSMALLVGFIIYQSYRYIFNHSLVLLWLTIFDLVVLVLTWHEYHFVTKHYFKKN